MPRPRARDVGAVLSRFAIAATRSITSRARASSVWRSRNSIGSAPAAEREFVHERFDRKHVGVRAESAQRRRSQRTVFDESFDDARLRESVQRPRVAMDADLRPEPRRRRHTRQRLLEMPRGDEFRTFMKRHRSTDVREAPHVVRPRLYTAARSVEVRFEVDAHRGSIRLPLMLLLPRPFQQHRAARHRACAQRRVQRHVVGAVVAVCTGTLRVDRRVTCCASDAQHFRDRRAEQFDALAVAPDRQTVGVPQRCRGGWRQRRVHHVRTRVARTHLGRSRWAPVQFAVPASSRGTPSTIGNAPASCCNEIVGELARNLQFVALSPRGAARACSISLTAACSASAITATKLPSTISSHEFGIAIDARAIERGQSMVISRRTHYARVQQTRQREIVDEYAFAPHLRRQVDATDAFADDAVVVSRLSRRRIPGSARRMAGRPARPNS